MHKFKIFETDRFASDLKMLSRAGLARLKEKLLDYVYPQLKEEPHFGQNIKKLQSWSPTTWRYRIGEWRFFYVIDDKMRVVSMIAASHRKEAYR